MISAVRWVPKGVSKYVPVVAEPPSKEEIEEALKNGALDRSGDSEEEEEMDVDSSKGEDEVAQALATAQALNSDVTGKSSSGLKDIMDGLNELDMDNYDDEDDGIEIFSSAVGDLYYPSNDLDPYLRKNNDNGEEEDEDDDSDEIEDMTIKPTDSVLVCARNEDEVNHLEVYIYEESEDGDPNIYVHHDVILPAYPLCLAWLDCNLKSGENAGNFMAVGSMDPAIEIWDLDVIDEVQPFMVLGGLSKKKREKGKKASKKYKKGSHRDAVLGLAWNKQIRNVLASASADKTVKIWDMVEGKCVLTLDHHSDKVQSVAWNKHSSEILLTGSFDQSVAVLDMKSGGNSCLRWTFPSDVESLVWDPHNEHSFVVSMENGMVQCFDKRAASSNPDSSSKPSFTLHAHEKATTSVSFSPVPNLLATGSMDKMVKLWDISNNEPSCIASQNPKAGKIFSTSFSEDSPFLLAIGGSKGQLQVWDTLSEQAVVNRFGKA